MLSCQFPPQPQPLSSWFSHHTLSPPLPHRVTTKIAPDEIISNLSILINLLKFLVVLSSLRCLVPVVRFVSVSIIVLHKELVTITTVLQKKYSTTNNTCFVEVRTTVQYYRPVVLQRASRHDALAAHHTITGRPARPVKK